MRLSYEPENLQINIPIQFWNITEFRSTLGHKVNHSFTKNKTQYKHVFHPRFGHIRSVVAKADIAKGEEIFVNYNYPIGGPPPVEWYKTVYEEEVGPWPEQRQKS